MQVRTTIGILLIFSGISFAAVGGFVMSRVLDRSATIESQAAQADMTCRAQLVRIGRITPLPNDRIQLEISDIDNGDDGLPDPRQTLSDASAALAMCPNMEIVSACLGTTCGTDTAGPVRMVMTLGAYGR